MVAVNSITYVKQENLDLYLTIMNINICDLLLFFKNQIAVLSFLFFPLDFNLDLREGQYKRTVTH